MFVGVVGLPNKGKTTFLSSCTSTSAEIADYPFTTINPNKGVSFVDFPCACKKFNIPHKSDSCKNGVRKIPVNILDVAGLIEGAHLGKGMGNQFLNDLSLADALIFVCDASGSTDDSGNKAALGSHDPIRDVEILFNEILFWMEEVVSRNALKSKGKGFDSFAESLSGIRVSKKLLLDSAKKLGLSEKDYAKWSGEEIRSLAKELLLETKPFAICANKCDLSFEIAEKNISRLKAAFPSIPVIACSADSELALKRASEKGWIERVDGASTFKENAGLPPAIHSALQKIDSGVIKKFGSTGVQECLDSCVFKLLEMIVVFPVEDETHLANHKGEVLPDAILLKKGSTALDLAEKIHSDLAKHFLFAVNVKTKMRISRETVLEAGDVIKVVSAK